MWHKTQRTENLFNEKKITLYPVSPDHTPASVNIHLHFWSTSWLITSWCLNSLPIVLPCRMATSSRLYLSGWTTIDSAQYSLMAFRSAAHLGPVATSTPARILLRIPPIAAWIAPLNSIRASHALDLASEIGFGRGRGGIFEIDALWSWPEEIQSV